MADKEGKPRRTRRIERGRLRGGGVDKDPAVMRRFAGRARPSKQAAKKSEKTVNGPVTSASDLFVSRGIP
jgi:hypothetical protein